MSLLEVRVPNIGGFKDVGVIGVDSGWESREICAAGKLG